jgi:hypothetical protein
LPAPSPAFFYIRHGYDGVMASVLAPVNDKQIADLAYYHCPIPVIVNHGMKKTGPQSGPGFSNCRRGGRQYLPEGNMLQAGDSGRIYPAQQRASSMRSVRQCDNANRRMSAMRNRKSLGIPQFHRSFAPKRRL